MAFPRQHRTKLHSANPIELPNKEVKRRADVVGISQASIMRLIGAVLFEQNDAWQTSSREMMVAAFAQIDKEEIGPIASRPTRLSPRIIPRTLHAPACPLGASPNHLQKLEKFGSGGGLAPRHADYD